MKVLSTAIPDVRLIEPAVHPDDRGFFLETWRAARYAGMGIDAAFAQDNHSHSVQGTLRGLHYQITQPQGKLVFAVTGAIYDVAVDLRRRSPSFGRWVGAVLSEENHRQLWIPPGFCHGFYVLSARADVCYKCTAVYSGPDERCIRWDDPDLNIEWPLREGSMPRLSPKDAAGTRLRDAEVYP